MAIAFISDLHLTPTRPESTALFEGFMDKAKGTLEQLYILGDLFEVWIGDDGSEELGQTSVEQTLKQASDSGVELFFMHGNRDFLIGENFEKRTGCTLLPDPTILSLDGEKVLLTHGDMLCIDDIEHQNARKQMVTSKWKIAFLNKPVEHRKQYALEMREKSERQKQHKSMEIMDVNQAYVESFMEQHGVLTMIHGHTHKPAVHEFTVGNQPARRFVLGDWYNQKSMLIYENNSFSLSK